MNQPEAALRRGSAPAYAETSKPRRGGRTAGCSAPEAAVGGLVQGVGLLTATPRVGARGSLRRKGASCEKEKPAEAPAAGEGSLSRAVVKGSPPRGRGARAA